MLRPCVCGRRGGPDAAPVSPIYIFPDFVSTDGPRGWRGNQGKREGGSGPCLSCLCWQRSSGPGTRWL